MADFAPAVEGVLKREGGYVNDPDDLGGETKYGISSRAYHGLNIKELTKTDAAEIYRADYWKRIRCDEISDQAVARVLFDHAVNAGRRGAAKMIQGMVGVTVDGAIGPKSLAAINSRDGEVLALRFTLARIAYYGSLAARRKSNRKFLLGWITRALEALND